ncbi:MAG: hypothetical protein KatS3mg118_3186 [Paracoccaceae bacterium]|nr:MAG: hypothetical protein KatS3mg118_3186 [Paracoccaceae bacterium]
MTDADPTPQPAPGAEPARFPCPSCGSEMRYSPATDRLTCPYCGATAPAPESARTASDPWGADPAPALAEQDFAAAVAELRARASSAETEETRIAQCTSCGAAITFEPDIHATQCPFCASPVVADTGPSRHIKPQGVLPFLIGEREARAAMQRWLDSLWFAPSGLKRFARAGRPMQGIYAPYWTYDARTESDYRGARGDAYYVTRTATVNGKRQMRRERRIRWTPRRGRVSRFFDDVLVLASRSLPRKYADRLAPWDLSALEPYDPQYLAGFRAEAYTVDVEEGFAEARRIMDAQIRQDVRRDIGGDEQRIDAISTRISDVTFKHILLPVWLSAYRYRGKVYRFIVNARTGEVQGERPWSAGKIALAVLAGLVLAAAIGWLVIRQQG